MGSTLQDLTGQQFGYLTVIGIAYRKPRIAWRCQCRCGVETVARAGNLRNGHTRSCGCAKGAMITARKITHGQAGSPLYGVWVTMIARCENPNTAAYSKYGGRGISVHSKWRESFEQFIADMGPRPSNKHSIERLNTNGNYEPTNCVWATRQQQANNQSNNRLLTIDGIERTATEWGRLYGISGETIAWRLNRKWSIRDAVMIPRLPTGRRGETVRKQVTSTLPTVVTSSRVGLKKQS